MAINLSSPFCVDDEDYIDMELHSSSTFFFPPIKSSSQTREFEFQMSVNSLNKEHATSPADELFYKGKLLPLHLPPRLQMVQTLLQTSDTKLEDFEDDNFYYSIPFITTSATPSIDTTSITLTLDSSESCRASSELNSDEYFFEWSTELSGSISDRPKKPWSRRLRLIKNTSLAQKLKASQAYLRSLFGKSGCSNKSCAKATSNAEAGHASKEECVNRYMKVAKSPFAQTGRRAHPTLASVVKSIDNEGVEDGVNGNRRSFSGAIKRYSAAKISSSSSSSSSSGASSLSSSFSFHSNGFHELQSLKRSSSANLETESSIEGAIAHCKQSQQLFSSRRAKGEVELCSVSAA